MKVFLATVIALTPVSAFANEYQKGYSLTRTCTRTEYKEEYVPGTMDSPGYVKSYEIDVEIPCSGSRASSIDANDCKEGSVIGGLLGAGLAFSGSRGKDRYWAVPAGGTAGALIGCQIDGG